MSDGSVEGRLDSNLQIVPYQAGFALETVKMWRQSFQRVMQLKEHNRLAELEPQLAYFCSLGAENITLVMDTFDSAVVGMMVLQDNRLEHLYVHIDYQNSGIGTLLISLAKERSNQYLELFTFQKNVRAQTFYLKHGFEELTRGFASAQDNPWARSKADLADIKYVWRGEV